MSVQRLQAHWGFTRMPFGRNLAPSMLHRHPGHGEAVARISWCVDQHALGVITGEVGAGKPSPSAPRPPPWTPPGTS
jgi:type II secretory pathway predicted ATPase ExeA